MYIGRFAPTPSGPLHFGSIITALGSFLDARKKSGQWLLRIDDLDAHRVREGAKDSILRTLELLGLHWDGRVTYQSCRSDAYRKGLDLLQSKRLVYPCICTRREVKGKPYPGTCRQRNLDTDGSHALRLTVNGGKINLADRIHGNITADIQAISGDFIVRRSDNIFAYHLAAVIDDHWQNVNNIVRGCDLIESTICQVYLQSKLGLSRPDYCHLPMAVESNGKKISKSSRAQNVLLKSSPETVLIKALEFLGHGPERELQGSSVEDIIQWGTDNWDITRVPKSRKIVVEKP